MSTIVASGTCGDNLTWTLDDNSTLTISGTGKMYDYSEAPWYTYSSSITTAIIEDGVTSIGDTETLTATILPDNADNKNVKWSSSDENVATVTNGVVTAKAAGTATITVTTEDGGYTASCTVTVTANASSVTIGDVNADGEVTPSDAVLFFRYIARWSGYEAINETNSDVNTDGNVDPSDAVALARHLAVWAGYEILPIV